MIELNEAKSRKYRGIFKVKCLEKTRQVRENWSQQMEHKQMSRCQGKIESAFN